MTLLIGIRCKDGVVVAADSAVTFGTLGGNTIEQKTQKIEIIGGALILAGTGAVGLAQRFSAQLEGLHATKAYSGKTPVEAAKQMCTAGVSDFSATSAKTGTFGALVAFRTRKELCLCEFDVRDFQPELKDDRIWYASMGCGQSLADPFLALIRRVFWKEGMPSLADGIFAATWALQHAIEVNTGGVNGPIHIATLTWDGDPAKPDTKAIARCLTVDEIAQHCESVDAAEKHLAGYRQAMHAGEAADVPKPQADLPGG